MCPTLWHHGLQHARLPCPSPTSGVYSNSCLLSLWCHSTVSSSVVPFSSGLQSFPASGSFPMSQLFASGGQSIGASASASVLPMNIQGCFPFLQNWLAGSPCCPGDSEEPPPTPQFKSINSLATAFAMVQLSHSSWLLEKPQLWLDRPLLVKWCLCLICCLCLSYLFFQGENYLISWLQSPSMVIMEPKKIKKGSPTHYPLVINPLWLQLSVCCETLNEFNKSVVLPTLPWNSHFFNLFLLCIPEWAQKDFYMYLLSFTQPSAFLTIRMGSEEKVINETQKLSYFSLSSHWILFQSSYHRAFSPSLCLCLHIIPLALIPVTSCLK